MSKANGADRLLDRPVWSALTMRQSAVSLGGPNAKRMSADIGIFAASADTSLDSLVALATLVPTGGEIALMEAEESPLPPGLALRKSALGWQMIAPAITPGEPAFEITTLTDADAPAMLALATLTEPGPFFSRTNTVGRFVGVKRDGRLVAMAGRRLSMPGHVEVSGVCTHPDHRGNGYAAGLMRVVARSILAEGDTPILHAYASNRSATALYETLGFTLRREMHITILARA